MPLKLYAPGSRKGNPYWLVRGTIDGRSLEVSTKTRDKAAARRFAHELDREYRARRVPRPGEAIDFARAADLYLDYRDPAKADRRRVDRLKLALGRKAIGDIRQVDLVDAANLLCANRTAATKNREVLRPASAILHYAAASGLVAPFKVKLFREPRPKTRALSFEAAAALVAAAQTPMRRLFLLWLFRQGTRLGDTLRVEWPNIDLARQVVKLRIGKRDLWTEKALQPEVFEALANLPERQRRQTGRLFSWGDKSNVYRWLRPLTRKLGIAFTPHMARHSLATWLNAQGEGLRTIMAALDHADPRSSIRYQAADIEIVRAAVARLPAFAPETGETPGSALKKAR